MDKWVRSILGTMFLALFAGCTAVAVSPDIMVNIPPANDAKWTMSTGQKSVPGSDVITLYINGTVLGSGDAFHAPVNIQGTYSGHAVQAICSVTRYIGQSGEIPVTATGSCVVYVDGTQVATLPY